MSSSLYFSTVISQVSQVNARHESWLILTYITELIALCFETGSGSTESSLTVSGISRKGKNVFRKKVERVLGDDDANQ